MATGDKPDDKRENSRITFHAALIALAGQLYANAHAKRAENEQRKANVTLLYEPVKQAP